MTTMHRCGRLTRAGLLGDLLYRGATGGSSARAHWRASRRWHSPPGTECSAPRLSVGSGLPAALLAAVWAGVPGCVQPAGSAPGTVQIEVIPGETASGNLFSGQELRGVMFVEAGHIYHITATVTEVTSGSHGIDEVKGVVSGAALAVPVEFVVESPFGGTSDGSGLSNVFVPISDDQVAIELILAWAWTTESSRALESIRRLISGPTRVTYELLVTDLGFDDNGSAPEDAVALAVGIEGELTGTISPGDEADFFVLQVEADTTYQLTLESTDSVAVTSGAEDRFGQVNFGVATAGGLSIDVSSSAGVPGISEFTAPTTEGVLLRLTASVSAVSPVSPSVPTVQYAITVVEVVPEEPPEGE